VASVKLRIRHAGGRVEERELAPGSYRIGREHADIVLPHRSVSAHHAQLEVTPARVVITDAGSRNGSFEPSGRRITQPYVLVPEQPIRLGAITLTLLRALGQAGGTRAMPEVPALPLIASPSPTRAPPRTSRWLKLVGVSVLLLLGFVSLKTCSALVQALSERPPSESPPSKAPSKPAPSKPAPSKPAASGHPSGIRKTR
jgi:hypothetical protein